MSGNTGASVVSNQTFTTGVVPIVVGVLNPANSPQGVWDCGVGMTYASITTVVAGSPTSFTILLEGTYDGNVWTQLASTSNTAGETQYSVGRIPFTNLRARCTAVSGGSSPTVNVFVTASQVPFSQGTGSFNPALAVAGGAFDPQQCLTNATTTVTGAVADFGCARHSFSFQSVAGAGVTGGAITFFGSVDNSTFTILTSAVVSGNSGGSTLSNGVLTFTAPGNQLISATNAGIAMRYFRADVTTNMAGGNVNVKVMAT